MWLAPSVAGEHEEAARGLSRSPSSAPGPLMPVEVGPSGPLLKPVADHSHESWEGRSLVSMVTTSQCPRNLIVTSIKGLTRQQPSQGLGCQSGSRKLFKDEEFAHRS